MSRNLGLKNRQIVVIAILAAFSITTYLLASYLTLRLGFPLDDAWIHQTYARNLGQLGEWAFVPGQSSAGSTAPLWSALLGIGYAIHLDKYIWTYFVGWGLLSFLGLLGSYIFKLLSPNNVNWPFWTGVLIVFEWHLVWAAASGMETILFSLLIFLILMLLFRDRKDWLIIGALSGLSIWIRPDGFTIIGPILFVLILDKTSLYGKGRGILLLLIGFLLLFLPYLIFNNSISGQWWPNTFYAKQAEYAIELNDPFWFRTFEQFRMPLIGVGILLLPGFFCTMMNSYRQWNPPALAGGAWAIGFMLVYAFRLPVTYQHGRYIIPIIPVYLTWSLVGVRSLYKPLSPILLVRVLSKTWIFSITLIVFGFWILGARAYARDVALIESEMVKSARWISENTNQNSIIAAHDIGALGYFGNRQIVDLAGLVSPDVVPFIRDEERLAEYMDQQGVEFLVTFPGWYPNLVNKADPVFNTRGDFSPAQGGENMAIYLWKSLRSDH